MSSNEFIVRKRKIDEISASSEAIVCILDFLPDELLLLIFTYLTIPDVGHFGTTDKRHAFISWQDELWKELIFSTLGIDRQFYDKCISSLLKDRTYGTAKQLFQDLREFQSKTITLNVTSDDDLVFRDIAVYWTVPAETSPLPKSTMMSDLCTHTESSNIWCWAHLSYYFTLHPNNLILANSDGDARTIIRSELRDQTFFAEFVLLMRLKHKSETKTMIRKRGSTLVNDDDEDYVKTVFIFNAHEDRLDSVYGDAWGCRGVTYHHFNHKLRRIQNELIEYYSDEWMSSWKANVMHIFRDEDGDLRTIELSLDQNGYFDTYCTPYVDNAVVRAIHESHSSISVE